MAGKLAVLGYGSSGIALRLSISSWAPLYSYDTYIGHHVIHLSLHPETKLEPSASAMTWDLGRIRPTGGVERSG